MTEDEERDARALELRRAGVASARIAEQLGYDSAAEVDAAVSAAIAPGVEMSRVRALELDRLDRLQQGLWPKAVKGDAGAVDRVIRLAYMRLQLAGVPDEGQHPMLDAYERTVAALRIVEADAALVEAGRRIVRQIDAAAATGDSAFEAKALYLVPHLVNVLRDLGATPAARDAVTGAARPVEERENELEQFKKRRGRPATA